MVANPYEPPRSPLEDESPRRGFRWRIIPAVFLAFFGGLLVFGMIFSIAGLLIRSPGFARNLGSMRTVGILLVGNAGCLWIASGALFWKRKWWRAAFCLLAGYASGVFGSYLTGR